ncbi:MAG TPA: 5-(carboxyamino)imidazole ribonucleotide synthase [Candidatus Obscuribacterales bacterium]
MAKEKVILPGATLGVLGGGQLGRMFAMAAQHLGYKVIAFTPDKNSPVSYVCSKTYVAPFDDESALRSFAGEVAGVTIEFENIPAQALKLLEELTRVRPGPQVLHITQNRLREKRFLQEKKFPVVPFYEVTTQEQLSEAIDKLGLPVVLKTAGFGYDGKGQYLINSEQEGHEAFKAMGGQAAVAEKFIVFEKEISIIGARSASGDFVAYGPVENEHRNRILDLSLAPARINWSLAEEAIDITRLIMDALQVVGLLCVEFFVSADEQLLVNELAPRPHNSGHYTIEACPTSQFEQQVRCLTGLPLGTTETERGAAMANLLGDIWSAGEPDWVSAVALPDVHLHLYGKQEARPGRKMGHLTACAKWADEALERVKSARDLLVSTNART